MYVRDYWRVYWCRWRILLNLSPTIVTHITISPKAPISLQPGSYQNNIHIIGIIYYINIYPYSSGIKGPSDKGHMIWVIGKVIKSPTKEEILSTTINLNIRHLMGLYKNALNCLKIIRIINQRKHNWVLVQFLSNFNSQKQGRPDMAGELPYQQLNQFTLFNTWTSQNSTFLALIEKN